MVQSRRQQAVPENGREPSMNVPKRVHPSWRVVCLCVSACCVRVPYLYGTALICPMPGRTCQDIPCRQPWMNWPMFHRALQGAEREAGRIDCKRNIPLTWNMKPLAGLRF